MIRTCIDNREIVVSPKLIQKYSQAGPRYTSYPTAPNWGEDFGEADFQNRLKEVGKGHKPLSLYFHIPFCEERCAFCACSVVATRRHKISEPYLEALTMEIKKVAEALGSDCVAQQLHWGGGTPTYLTCEQIEKLYKCVTGHFSFSDSAEISIEIDPRVTTEDHLKILRSLGFNRVSLGVQDFEPEVQRLAGRIQSEEETRRTVEICKSLEFKSINLDLVYGLGRQTPQTFGHTIQKVLELDVDRIALFHFAYVPWMHIHQKKIEEGWLPSPTLKLEMFCQAISSFGKAGYEFIGLDHFAKQDDDLAQAKRNGTMYRNFQGYTTKGECDLIGLGVTSISQVAGAFAQNAKKLKNYQDAIFQNGFATRRGFLLSQDDLVRQWVIREIFCHQRVKKKAFQDRFEIDFDLYFEKESQRLISLRDDGLIDLLPDEVVVAALGRLFLRNVGMAFDTYLQPGSGRFSRTL